MTWYNNPTHPLNITAQDQAAAHQDQLTKPQGSLGELERIVIRLAAMQGTAYPSAQRVCVAIFAGDHGMAAAGVSAFAQAVTRQMVANFAQQGACASVMAKSLGASFEVVDCGTVGEPYQQEGVIFAPIAQGTNNALEKPAMSIAQCQDALLIGAGSVERALAKGAELYVAGEMGIGNTTAAAALACLLLAQDAKQMTGRGTGVIGQALQHKIDVVNQLVERYQADANDPLQSLANVGGFEMVAMTGAYIRAAQAGLPCVVDGFIASVSALTAVRINAGVADYLLFGHQSAEHAHGHVLQALGAAPILDLGMRLGEGSGALASVPIVRLACQVHSGMATFASAAVDTSNALL